MTGPTTTGSIDAKLTIDKSSWDEKAADVKAEARELGALNPEVKVDANVGPALAKLEAVARAERDLDTAYQRSAIAQEKLSQVTKKYGDDSTQAASARLSLTRATNAESDAEAKLSGLKHEGARAQDEETAATHRGIEANNRRVSGIGVLIALAPAILAASAPIAAGAVGLGAAFGVMGVTGVLAIKGIHDAMLVGDTVGNTYAAGLGVVKDNLNQLAATSANGMLAGFSHTIDGINANMPFLARMTGEFSAKLGSIGGTLMGGFLTGLQQMNPLIQAGGNELGKFATWLTSFNGTSGFNQFIAYAIENLPSVMHLIESLVTTAGHILAAFAPMGPVVIGVLTGISDVLNALPLPVLAGLVTTATTVAPAMQIAGTAIAMFGIKTQLAIPVVGLITAALSGLGMMVATAALGTDQGTAAMTSYGDAVQRDNGLIGENVRLQAAHAATTKEMRDAADSLGVSTTTVLNAMLGNTQAQDTLNGAMSTAIDRRVDLRKGDENLTETSIRLDGAKKTLTAGISQNSTAIQNNVDAYRAYKDATDAGTGATSAQTIALQSQAGQYGATVAAYQAAKTAQDQTAQSTADATIKMQLQNDAAGLLKMALDGLNGKAVSAAQAQNAFDSSLVNMGDHVTTTGKQITFTTTSIGDMSSASVALRGQLNGQVTALQQTVEANGGLNESTGKAKAQMETMRQQIIDNAVAHGVDKDAVTAYVDNLLKIPASIPPTKLDVDNAAANQKLADTQFRLDQLQSKRIFISVERSDTNVSDQGAVKGSSLPTLYAKGGMVNYLASGGAPRFIPQGTDTVPAMLTPGEIVMNRASVDSLGAGNLLHANKTGQWPGQGQQQAPPVVNVYVGNEQLDARMYTVAAGAIGSANQDAGRRAAR